ncbi:MULTISPECIES: hypothetical protein [Cytobacillus]|uniref:hypothetical protein n=1 Tax=Cytobacillus TaxID=2675230 RepID=UPI00203F4612|nr:hypothetical protein [Cytobacillus firmus]MCM3706031.1 hypothetical protein [Cytobacillus firmus]
MNILNFFGQDEFKQQQIARFIVEAALLQFIVSFVMIALYVFTSIEPLFLMLIPFALFLFYCIIRYMLSGIEFADVFTEQEYSKMKKRNLKFAIWIFFFNGLAFFFIEKSLLESSLFGLISGILMWGMNTISLKKSYKKNEQL